MRAAPATAASPSRPAAATAHTGARPGATRACARAAPATSWPGTTATTTAATSGAPAAGTAGAGAAWRRAGWHVAWAWPRPAGARATRALCVRRGGPAGAGTAWPRPAGHAWPGTARTRLARPWPGTGHSHPGRGLAVGVVAWARPRPWRTARSWLATVPGPALPGRACLSLPRAGPGARLGPPPLGRRWGGPGRRSCEADLLRCGRGAWGRGLGGLLVCGGSALSRLLVSGWGRWRRMGRRRCRHGTRACCPGGFRVRRRCPGGCRCGLLRYRRSSGGCRCAARCGRAWCAGGRCSGARCAGARCGRACCRAARCGGCGRRRCRCRRCWQAAISRAACRGRTPSISRICRRGSRRPALRLLRLSLLRALRRERFLEPADHRRLDRGGRRPHELAHFLELGHHGLALNAELFRELVYPDLRHYAPSTRSGSPGPSGPARAQAPAGVRLWCSSPRSHRALITIDPCFPGSTLPLSRRPGLPTRTSLGGTPRTTPPDIARVCRLSPGPPGAAPGRMPGGVALARSTSGWDARRLPGQATAPGDRGQPRSHGPPRAASQSWPHEPCTPRTSGLQAHAPGTGTAQPFQTQAYRAGASVVPRLVGATPGALPVFPAVARLCVSPGTAVSERMSIFHPVRR